jgi:hypothetical protein
VLSDRSPCRDAVAGPFLRALTLLVLLVVALLAVSTATTQDRAHAFTGGFGPMTLTVPAALAGTSAVTGTGAGTVIGGGSGALAAAVAAPVAVAAAGLAVGYGIGTAIRWAWGQATGPQEVNADPGYADGPVPSATTHDYGGAWESPGNHDWIAVGSSSPNEAVRPTVGVQAAVSFPSTNTATLTLTSAPSFYSSGYRVKITCRAPYDSYEGPAFDRELGVIESTASCLSGGTVDSASVDTAFSGTKIRYVFPSAVTPAPLPAPATPGSTTLTTTPTSRCSDGSSSPGAPVSYTGSTPSAELPELQAGACPAGAVRTGVEFPTTRPDGSVAPSPLPTLQPVIPDAFADCNPALGKVCVLTFVRVIPGSTTELDCQQGFCPQWQTQTQPTGKTTTRTRTTTGLAGEPVGSTFPAPRLRYPNGDELECRWGTYLLVEADCAVVPTEPAPEPTTGTGTGTGTGPAEGNCNLSDFSLNPVSWVVVPLKCLFIPRDSSVQAAGQAVGTAWSGTAPAVATAAVGDVVSPVAALKDAPAQSCEGPEFVIPQLPTMAAPLTLHPLSTCNRLTTYLLGIYMPLATALTYLGGFFVGTRILLKAFGAESPVDA